MFSNTKNLFLVPSALAIALISSASVQGAHTIGTSYIPAAHSLLPLEILAGSMYGCCIAVALALAIAIASSASSLRFGLFLITLTTLSLPLTTQHVAPSASPPLDRVQMFTDFTTGREAETLFKRVDSHCRRLIRQIGYERLPAHRRYRAIRRRPNFDRYSRLLRHVTVKRGFRAPQSRLDRRIDVCIDFVLSPLIVWMVDHLSIFAFACLCPPPPTPFSDRGLATIACFLPFLCSGTLLKLGSRLATAFLLILLLSGDIERNPGMDPLIANVANRRANGPGYGNCAARTTALVLEAATPFVIDIGNQLDCEVHHGTLFYADLANTLQSKMEDVAYVVDDPSVMDPSIANDPRQLIVDALHDVGGLAYTEPGFEDEFHGLHQCVAVTRWNMPAREGATPIAAIRHVSIEGHGHCYFAQRCPDGTWTTDDDGFRRTGLSEDEMVKEGGGDVCWIWIDYPAGSVDMERGVTNEMAVHQQFRDDELLCEVIIQVSYAVLFVCRSLAALHPKASDTVKWVAAKNTPFTAIIRFICATIIEDDLLACDPTICKEDCDGTCKYDSLLLFQMVIKCHDGDEAGKSISHYVKRQLKKVDAGRVPLFAFCYYDEHECWYLYSRLHGTHLWYNISEDLAPIEESEMVQTCTDIGYIWIDNLPKLANNSTRAPCSKCGKSLEEHKARRIYRSCCNCSKTFFGECCDNVTDVPTHFNENLSPNDPRVTTFACAKCIADTRARATPTPSHSDTTSTCSSSRRSSRSSSRKSASPDQCPNADEDAPLPQSAPAPRVKQIVKKPEQVFPTTNCAGCGALVKGTPSCNGHAFKASYRKCCRCHNVYYGQCHGEEHRTSGATQNDKSDYVCKKCSPPSAPVAVPPPPAYIAPLTTAPAPAPVPTPAPAPAPAVAQLTTPPPRPAAVPAAVSKKFTTHAALPSTTCVGCNAPSHNHAFNETWRQCSKCNKYRYGRCHGEGYRKMDNGTARNACTDYVCNSCLPADAKRSLRQPDALKPKPLPASDDNNFAAEHCAACDIMKHEHDHSSSWRRCQKCSSYTFGDCHGQSKAKTKNDAVDFTCAPCSGAECPVNTARREHEQAKSINDETKLPEGYDEKTNPILGKPSANDLAAAIPANATVPSLAETDQQDFRPSFSHSPAGALVTGEVFSRLVQTGKISSEVEKCQATGTTQHHIKHLALLKRHLDASPEWKNIPITRAATRFLLIQSKARNWKPQTLQREAQSLHGAMTNLQLYTNAKVGINFGQDSYWTFMMRFWRLRSNQNQPHGQAALLADQVVTAIEATPATQPETKFAIALMWQTSARFSDVANLRREDIKWDPATRMLDMTIKEGKVMMKTQPYTVSSQVNDRLAPIVDNYLQLVQQPHQRLFPFTSIDRTTRLLHINQALQQVGKEYTTRSIRRGALQAMASKGIPLETVMLYSGHKSQDTAKRYLDWGRLCSEAHTKMRDAAAHLRPTFSP